LEADVFEENQIDSPLSFQKILPRRARPLHLGLPGKRDGDGLSCASGGSIVGLSERARDLPTFSLENSYPRIVYDLMSRI